MLFSILNVVLSILLVAIGGGLLYDATKHHVYRRRLKGADGRLMSQLQLGANQLGFEYSPDVPHQLAKVGDSVLSRWILPTQIAYRNHVHATLGDEEFDLFEAFQHDGSSRGAEYVLIVGTTASPTPLALAQMDENSVYVVGNHTVKVRTGRLDPYQLEDFIGSVCHVIDLASTP